MLLLPVMKTMSFKLRKFYLVRVSNSVHRIAGCLNNVFFSCFWEGGVSFFFLMLTKRFAFFQFCLIGLIGMFTTVEDCYVS